MDKFLSAKEFFLEGCIFLEAEDFQNAEYKFKKSLELIPDRASTLTNLSVAQFKLKKYSDAETSAKRAILIESANTEAYLNLGLIEKEYKRYESSSNYFDKALSLKPDYAQAWSNKAVIFYELKRYDEAIAHYDKALSFKPDYHEAWSNKGVTLNELKRYDEAIAHYDKALSFKPDYAEGWFNKGATLNELKRYDEAIAHYDKALSLKPDYAEAWSNKGVTLNELKRYDEAIAHYDKALSLKPDHANAWSNKGVTLHELKCYDEAIAHYDKALNLKADYHEAWTNKGVTLHELKCYDEAIAHYDKALNLKADYHEASWNKSLSLLIQGDFENGLPLYESRWASEKVSENAGKRFFDKPVWLGVESLYGKVILIYGEQGLGDFIQFCRYVKLVSGLGAKVVLEVPQPLANLIGSLEGVSELIIRGERLPPFDYQCPIMSLPLAFHSRISSIPADIPYLAVPSKKVAEWQLKLGEKRRKRVGLVWSGNPHHKNDHSRSLLLQDILPFLTNQIDYVSLQKEIREVDKSLLNSNPHLMNFAGDLNDFLDTAALIKNLDLVISIDTSVAHLSGALGKRTWLLLPNVPDWRWLLDREDSPWYPSIKLYRQPAIGDWSSVLYRVQADLNMGIV